MLSILNGKREEIIDGTPVEYSTLYTECWKHEPNERPNMQDVFSALTSIVTCELNNADDQLEEYEIISITSESSKGTMDLNNELVSNHDSYLDVNGIEISLNSQNQKHAQSDSSNILIRSRKSSFNSFDPITTLCEIVREIKLHQFIAHENIIQFYGITKMENVDQMNMNKYILVLEYADNGTLDTYLNEHFNELSWNDKLSLALQLASAVSCFHNNNIIHQNLHANKILVHQKSIKLADFVSGKREKIIDGTPEEYSKLYAECWNYEPQKRPDMQQVVSTLNQIVRCFGISQDVTTKEYLLVMQYANGETCILKI
ncbi:unnamed protein product [Rhizophagus irregularis]|nr:unnamed protein product [Rhizophagus irregularis]